MKKTSKDILINCLSIAVAALSLITGWWCVLLGPLLFFRVRTVLGKALYNDIDTLETRLMGWAQDQKTSAVRELAKCADPRARELLFAAMNRETPDVQMAAARSLIDIGDDRANGFLVKTMKSDNSTLRKSAAQLLTDTGWEPKTQEECVQQWIAVGDFKRPVGEGIPAMPSLLKAFEFNRADAAARTDIVWALAGIGTPDVVDPLLRIMESDESRAVKYSAEKALKPLAHIMAEAQRSRFSVLSAQLAQRRKSRVRSATSTAGKTATAQGLCDICNTSTSTSMGGRVFALRDVRRATDRGFNGMAIGPNATMLEMVGISRQESYPRWKQQVFSDTTDYLLCPSCQKEIRCFI